MKSKRKDRCSGIENLEQRRLLAIDTAVVPGLTFESAQVFSPPGIDRDGLAATEYIDLDGDGHRDLIYARQSANGFSVSQSLGDGNFESPLTSTAIREQILHLHAADINGDNVMDLLAASQNKVYSLLGTTTNGAWSGFELNIDIVAKTNSISVGDVDADGNADLVLANSQAIVYSGDGAGSFTNPIAYASKTTERRAGLADLDDDGDLDLVTTERNGVAVLRNDAGIFENQIDSISETNNLPFHIGDANGDGKADLWLSLGNREHAFVGLLPGNGDGTFDKNIQKYETLGTALDMSLADINGDSRMDLVVGHDNTFHHPVNNNGPGGVSILLANETGSYHDAIRISTPNGNQVYVDDTNDDGILDIVAAHRDSVKVYHQRTDGDLRPESQTFEIANSNPFGSGVQFAMGDINGDSHVDVALTWYDWSRETGQLELLLGSETGEFTPRVMPLKQSVASVHIANVHAGGGLEVLLHQTDFSRSSFSVIDVDENNDITEAITTRMSSSWNIQGEFDANEDGFSDFVGSSDGKTQLLIGGADGKFRTELIRSESGYRTPPLVDFNNDGHTDIIISGSNSFTVLLGEGDGTFSQSHRQTFQFPDVGVGDFDGDGHLDVAYANFSDPKLNIAFGSGDGTFASAKRFDRVENSTFHIADFNGDGRSDLLFDAYQKFEIHLSDGEAFEPIGESLSLAHSIRQITTADINGDGENEFLLTPGLDISTPQAQISVLDAVDFEQTPSLMTTTFPNTIVSPATLVDFDSNGHPDAIAIASMNGFFTVAFEPAIPSGDINQDGITNVDDIDVLCQQVHAGGDLANDLVPDGVIDLNDVEYLVEVILGSAVGDVTGDGVFDSSDFVEIFQVAEYEDEVAGNSRWSEGDWNCDGDFTTADFVYAFTKGAYSAAATPAGHSGVNAGAIADRIFEESLSDDDQENWKSKGAII